MINSRRKGASGELELAKKLNDLLPGQNIRRTVQYNGKANGSSADLVGLPGYHIECKRTAKSTLYKWMDQAISDCNEGETPIVVHRANKHDWVVICKLEDFFNRS